MSEEKRYLKLHLIVLVLVIIAEFIVLKIPIGPNPVSSNVICFTFRYAYWA